MMYDEAIHATAWTLPVVTKVRSFTVIQSSDISRQNTHHSPFQNDDVGMLRCYAMLQWLLFVWKLAPYSRLQLLCIGSPSKPLAGQGLGCRGMDITTAGRLWHTDIRSALRGSGSNCRNLGTAVGPVPRAPSGFCTDTVRADMGICVHQTMRVPLERQKIPLFG